MGMHFGACPRLTVFFTALSRALISLQPLVFRSPE